LNLQQILLELKTERNRIGAAIAALEGRTHNGTKKDPVREVNAPPRRRQLTAAGRKRLSELMKRRWAARRKKAVAK
jgi:hypothetical protein